jgi:hypothetical protein
MLLLKERGVAVHIMWRFKLSLNIFYCQIKKQKDTSYATENIFSIMYILLHNKYRLHSRTIYLVTKWCWPFKVLFKIFNNLFIMTCLLCHIHSVSDRKRPVELKSYVFIIFQYLLNNENTTTKIMKVDLVKGKVNPRDNAKVHLNERIFFMHNVYFNIWINI